MSRKKEILNLTSQANQYRIKADDLCKRAEKLAYLDALEKYGLEDRCIVQLKDIKARVVGIKGISNITGYWLDAIKINKDGSDSPFHVTIFEPSKIIGIER
jgi:hypothetical protein